MRGMKCIDRIYDPDLDMWWGLFQIEDEVGKIRFRIPINEEDFEIGKIYFAKFYEA